MNKLLDSLRGLDPTTWRKLEEIKTAIRDAEEGWRVDGVEYYFGADIFPMIVQGAIQDAITARGWDYQVGRFRALPLASAMVWIGPGIDSIGRRGPSESEAILAAYVAALGCKNAD